MVGWVRSLTILVIPVLMNFSVEDIIEKEVTKSVKQYKLAKYPVASACRDAEFDGVTAFRSFAARNTNTKMREADMVLVCAAFEVSFNSVRDSLKAKILKKYRNKIIGLDINGDKKKDRWYHFNADSKVTIQKIDEKAKKDGKPSASYYYSKNTGDPKGCLTKVERNFGNGEKVNKTVIYKNCEVLRVEEDRLISGRRDGKIDLWVHYQLGKKNCLKKVFKDEDGDANIDIAEYYRNCRLIKIQKFNLVKGEPRIVKELEFDTDYKKACPVSVKVDRDENGELDQFFSYKKCKLSKIEYDTNENNSAEEIEYYNGKRLVKSWSLGKDRLIEGRRLFNKRKIKKARDQFAKGITEIKTEFNESAMPGTIKQLLAELYIRIAIIAQIEHDFILAKSYYLAARKVGSPNQAGWALRSLAIYHALKGDHKTAGDYFKEALKVSPYDANNVTSYIEWKINRKDSPFGALGTVEKAIQYWSAIKEIKAQKTLIALVNVKVKVLISEHRLTEALKYMKRYQVAGANDASFVLLKSKILLREGKFLQALGLAKKGLSLNRKSGYAQFHYGLCLWYSEQLKQGKAAFQKSIQILETKFFVFAKKAVGENKTSFKKKMKSIEKYKEEIARMEERFIKRVAKR